MNPDMSGNGQTDVINVMAEVTKLDGQAHPFVNKDAVQRYHKILLECYEAQLAWRVGS